MSLILDQLAHICDIASEEKTTFSANEAAGQTILSVVNVEGFAADNYVILGEPGTEKAELRKVASVDAANNTITVSSAIAIAHSERDPVIRTPYNQVKIYFCATEDGTYAQIAAGSPLAMEVNQYYTYLVDAAGTALTWYKFSWYNSTSAAESALSSAFLGGKPGTLCTLWDVKSDLQIPLVQTENDKKIIDLCRRVTDEIIEFTGAQFFSRSITDEYQDIEEGQGTVFPDYYPIYGTTMTVEDAGSELTYDSDPDLTDYHIYPGYIVRAVGNFTPGRKRVKLGYTAWHGSVPEDVKQVAMEMVEIRAGLKVRTFIDNEGITQAAVLRSVPKDMQDILIRYQRKVV